MKIKFLSVLIVIVGAGLFVACSAHKSTIVDMRAVSGGTFAMCGKVETTLSDFSISLTPVTQKQWKLIMANNPSRFLDDNKPVELVSWFDAVEFCNALSLREGLKPAYSRKDYAVTWDKTSNGYRLPTEAEFEYAARGGQKSQGYTYPGGNNIDEVAWYIGNSRHSTHQVAQKKPNELGLYDMSGNVYQWCWDWFQDSLVGGVNPIGPQTGRYFHVFRGGSWDAEAIRASLNYRQTFFPDSVITGLGFRVVRN